MRCKGALRAFARAFTAIITGDEGLFSGAQVGILLIDNDQSLQLAAHSSGRSGAIAIQNAQLVHEIEDKRRQPEVANKRREYLKVIRSSGPHLLVLINDMRNLSKIEAGRMDIELRCFDLAWLLDHSMPLVCERAAPNRLTLALEAVIALDDLLADAPKIKQVVVNLLPNAVKFTPSWAV